MRIITRLSMGGEGFSGRKGRTQKFQGVLGVPAGQLVNAGKGYWLLQQRGTAAPGRPRMAVACQIAAVIRLPRLLVRPTSMGKEGSSEIVFQRTWSSQTLRK